MTGQACPTGCGRQRRRSHMMCAPCWRLVPPDLQRDVYRTWRTALSGRDGAWENYQQAREAALASIP